MANGNGHTNFSTVLGGKLKKRNILNFLKHRKKILAGAAIVLAAFFILNSPVFKKDRASGNTDVLSQKIKIERSFDLSALNNQGVKAKDKVKVSILNADKTNQVIVKDQTFTAKNDKMFLIIDLELKNDSTQTLNMIPGDLARLSFASDDENKYAPDLHNNIVPVAAISTKPDRIGFVVPSEIKDFKLFIGEIEGTKEVVTISFPS